MTKHDVKPSPCYCFFPRAGEIGRPICVKAFGFMKHTTTTICNIHGKDCVTLDKGMKTDSDYCYITTSFVASQKLDVKTFLSANFSFVCSFLG